MVIGGDQVGTAGITEILLHSPSALQALGRALAPLFGSINPSTLCTLGNMTRIVTGSQPPWTPSQVSALPIPPWVVPPFQLFPTYMYSFPHIHPSQGILQYSAIHQSDQGCSSWQKSSSPGNPGSASSCPHRQEEVCWHHLVDPLEENLLVFSISKPLNWGKEKPGCRKWRQYTSDQCSR